MRKLLGLALLGVAACGSEPEVSLKNATPEQVAAKVQEVRRSPGGGEMRFEPGEWRVEIRVQDVEAKGMPDQAVQQIKTRLAGVTSNTHCLTPEQASRPSSEMFAGKQSGQCKYDSFEMADGKLKGQLSCPGRSGGKMAMTMEGSYEKSSYVMNAAVQMENAAPGQTMSVRIQSTGQRIGECRPESKG